MAKLCHFLKSGNKNYYLKAYGGDHINIKINELNDLKLFSHINILSNILLVTLRIDLYKKIGQKKYTITELSNLLNCHTDRLKRILKLLVDIGLINYENEEYSNSKLSYKYLTGLYNNRMEGNLSYFPQEDKIMKFILKCESRPMTQCKESVGKYLERMEFNSRYSAYWLWKKLKPSGKKYFLDVGCGSGIFSFVMCERDKYLCADCIDQYETILILNEKIKQKGLENRIKTRVCNIKNNDFTNGNTYDYILISNILHFLSSEEIDRVLQVSYNSLEKDGKIIISDVFPIDNDIETLCYSFMWMQDIGVLLLEREEIIKRLSINKYKKIEEFRIKNIPSTFLIAQKDL